MPAELESYLESILSQGERVSSGYFSLDLAAARRKMGHFFAPNEVDFLHYWVRFAVAQKATRIEVKVSSNGLEFNYHGPPPGQEQIAAGVLAPQLVPRYLHMGVLGAFQQGFLELVLETEKGLVQFLPDQPERLVSATHPGEVCRFTARARPGGVHWKNLESLGRALHFPGLHTPLFLQGKQLNKPAGERLLRVDAMGREWMLQLPLFDPVNEERLTPAAVHILVHGADLGGLATHAFPPSCELWVEYPEIPLDLSMRKVHEDVPFHQLSCELAELAAQMVAGLDSRLLPKLAPGVLDWLAEVHCQQGRYQEAFQATLHGVALAVQGPHLLGAALLERAALLADMLQDVRAGQLSERAARAWQSLDQIAQEADPHWLDHELTQASPDQALRAARFQEKWGQLVRAGCVCRSEHDGMGPAYERVRGSFTLALYRETIRRSVHPEHSAFSAEFLTKLKKYRQDSLIYNGLLLRNVATLSPRACHNSSVVFAAQLLAAALQGQEKLPDQDLDQLTLTQRASLIELLETVCRSAVGLSPDGFTRDFERVRKQIKGLR